MICNTSAQCFKRHWQNFGSTVCISGWKRCLSGLVLTVLYIHTYIHLFSPESFFGCYCRDFDLEMSCEHNASVCCFTDQTHVVSRKYQHGASSTNTGLYIIVLPGHQHCGGQGYRCGGSYWGADWDREDSWWDGCYRPRENTAAAETGPVWGTAVQGTRTFLLFPFLVSRSFFPSFFLFHLSAVLWVAVLW